MKVISIRKSYDFSPGGKVFVHSGNTKIHIKGYNYNDVTINPGENLYATQQWTSSRKIEYDELTDRSKYLIKPRLGKVFAFIVLIVFSVCTCIFIFTRWRWSVLPLLPFAVSPLLYVSVLKNRFLIIKKDTE